MATETKTTETKIKDYIAKNLLFSDNGFPYGDDASFLEEGIVDSVGIMDLVSFVEDSFKVSVADADITPENFDSVTRLTAYLRHKGVN
jgi:acyl carrier protein